MKNERVELFRDDTYIVEFDSKKNKYYAIWESSEGEIECEITREVAYKGIGESKRVNRAIANEYSRHIEHSELTEISLENRATYKQETVEDTAIYNRDIDSLLADIKELTEIQRERYSLNYKGYSCTEIAEMKGCSIKAITKSIKQAEVIIKKYYKKFQ